MFNGKTFPSIYRNSPETREETVEIYFMAHVPNTRGTGEIS